MKRQVWRHNFDTYFKERTDFIGLRAAMYRQDVENIANMARDGSEQDLHALVLYLRPWNIGTEGNWHGREWVRVVAMQALCYVGAERPPAAAFLERVISSEQKEWTHFDDDLRQSWRNLTDVSCLPDPYGDFVRCIKEVLGCIRDGTSGEDA